MPNLDATHDPNRKSWVESANRPGCDFPIQNLPFGTFETGDQPEDVRVAIAIGEHALDLTRCAEEGLLEGLDDETTIALHFASLNDLMGLGPASWRRVRSAAAGLLDAGNARLRDNAPLRGDVLPLIADVSMIVPATIGDYTDFYASIHHATNVGTMFRPDNALLPNYKHLPVGYHGRASSIVVSGTPIRRPMGQTVATDLGPPAFGPCKLLDYEMELGFFVGAGNAMGSRIQMPQARERIFGMCILNDWSARDIQKWEYQPLGPFNAKNFGTTVSPWIVTLDALEPYRVPGAPRGEGDPELLDYLKPTDDMGFDITVEVRIASEQMRAQNIEPALISRGSFAQMYWTIAQMLVHHSSTGCNMRPGDLLASGTISGPTEDSRGCLLERTWRGQNPVSLPDGTQRKFLQDGDEVVMTAYCQKPGAARIGFGECRGAVLPVTA